MKGVTISKQPRQQVMDSGMVHRYRTLVIAYVDQLVTAVVDEVKRAGGAAVLL